MSMAVIQLGSLSIMLKWVILGIAVILGLVLLKIWLKGIQEKETQKKIFDILSNSIFIGFVSWKASLLLLEPQLIIKSPLSLLYFTGGSKGLLIAIIITISYVFFKLKKLDLSDHQIIHIALFFSLAVVGGYHIIFAILLNNDTIYHLLIGIVTLSLFLFIYLRNVTVNGLFNVAIIWSFSTIVLQLTLLSISTRPFLFTLEQWFFIGLIIISFFYINKKK